MKNATTVRIKGDGKRVAGTPVVELQGGALVARKGEIVAFNGSNIVVKWAGQSYWDGIGLRGYAPVETIVYAVLAAEGRDLEVARVIAW